jgi:hypothetical protein
MRKTWTRFRSAITGRFVKRWVNRKYPKSTIKQTLRRQPDQRKPK